MFINNKLNSQVRNYIIFNLKNIDLIAITFSKGAATGQVGLGVGSWLSNRATEGSNPKGTRLYSYIALSMSYLFNEKLNDFLHMPNQENKTMFLTGDFNINTIDAIINPNNFQNTFTLFLYTLN